MNPKQLSRALLRFLENLADLCLISGYWLICCLPLISFAASSAALYYTALKVVRHGEGHLTRTFFLTFRQHFKRSIPLSLIFIACSGLLWLYRHLGGSIASNDGLFMVYWAVVALLFVIFAGVFTYAFVLTARFRQKTGATLRDSLFLSLGYPLRTLGLLVLTALGAWTVYHAPLMMLSVPGAYACGASFLLEPVLKTHSEKA